VFPNLVGYIERGEIRPLIAKTFPLERIADAQREVSCRSTMSATSSSSHRPPVTDELTGVKTPSGRQVGQLVRDVVSLIVQSGANMGNDTTTALRLLRWVN
jgi:hypothetical protein